MITCYIFDELLENLNEFPVLGIVDSRQVGKNNYC